MSKVLIDRALLERVQERLDPHRDAVLWGAVCDTFHTAPSGTPAMPVKAYYHEAPNEYGGFNKSVGLEVRKEFADAPLVLESDAMARVACLEGEIAKRDETIARLEPQLNRAIQANYDLREELAACRVAVENCEVFRARIVELEARIVWLECEAQVNAAPVSEAKAQGVVMPERWNVPRPMWKDVRQPYGNPLNHADIEAAEKFNLALDEVARLNATPAQQVSVPDDFVCDSKPLQELLNATAMLLETPCQDSATYWAAQLANVEQLLAAPAAPAADAGLVDMYRHLQKVTPYRFKKIQDASITDGGDVMYFHKDRFDAALLADMAAHRAKGVV